MISFLLFLYYFSEKNLFLAIFQNARDSIYLGFFITASSGNDKKWHNQNARHIPLKLFIKFFFVLWDNRDTSSSFVTNAADHTV